MRHNDSTIDTRNQIKHQYIQEAIISKIASVEEAQIRCTQYDLMNICIVLQFMTRMIQIQLFCRMMINTIYFFIGTHLLLKTFACGNTAAIGDVVEMCRKVAFGHSLSFTNLLLLKDSGLKVLGFTYKL